MLNFLNSFSTSPSMPCLAYLHLKQEYLLSPSLPSTGLVEQRLDVDVVSNLTAQDPVAYFELLFQAGYLSTPFTHLSIGLVKFILACLQLGLYCSSLSQYNNTNKTIVSLTAKVPHRLEVPLEIICL